MKLPERRRQQLIRRAISDHVAVRTPDFVIGTADEPYLRRWYVVRHGQRWLSLSPAKREMLLRLSDPRKDNQSGRNIYVHQFLRSDDDRALHDHPWPWRTIVLEGEYIEHVPANPDHPAGPTVGHHRRAGDIGTRRAGTDPHRVELINGKPALTLFVTGHREREWGFWCKHGFRHWREFTAPGNSGEVGRGCE